MKEREQIIRRWFDMWLLGEDSGISDLFTEDTVYILRAGARNTTARKNSATGLPSGMPGERSWRGTSVNISIRGIKQWWSGFSAAKWRTERSRLLMGSPL